MEKGVHYHDILLRLEVPNDLPVTDSSSIRATFIPLQPRIIIKFSFRCNEKQQQL